MWMVAARDIEERQMILCCGEALIDMVPVMGVEGHDAFAPLSGGAIFNTAIALGRLEVPVQLLSGVSNDLFGTQLASELQSSNVGTDLLVNHSVGVCCGPFFYSLLVMWLFRWCISQA